MILTTVAVLVGIGLALFATGHHFDRPEIAMFGAIIIIGVGAGGAVDGYQVQTGEVQVTENTAENETVTTINETYDDVSVHTEFPLAIVLLLLGAVMLIGASGEASEADIEQDPPWKR